MSSKYKINKRKPLSDKQFALAVTIPVAIILLSMVIYPLSYSFYLGMNSFKVRKGKIQMEFVGADNYIEAVTDPAIQNSILKTLQYGLEGVLLSVFLSLVMALVLNEAFKGRAVLRVVALLPWAISDFMTGVSWKYLMIQGVGFVDAVMLRSGLADQTNHYITKESAIHLLAIAEAWHVAPIGAFFLLAGLQVIPEDIVRQAQVDGASAFKRFFKIKLPLIQYSLLITFVISTLFILQALDVVLLLTGGGPGIATQTLPYMTYKEFFSLFHLGYGAAISYILLGIVFCVAMTWFRLLYRGPSKKTAVVEKKEAVATVE